jgi:hypothetical protein
LRSRCSATATAAVDLILQAAELRLLKLQRFVQAISNRRRLLQRHACRKQTALELCCVRGDRDTALDELRHRPRRLEIR